MKNARKILMLALLSTGAFFSMEMKAQEDIPDLGGDTDTETPGTGSSFTYHVKAKGDMMLSQYWAMPTLLNPAATGNIDFIRIRGGARLQYLGSRQSPKNFLATADMPFKVLEKRIGAGVVVNSESFDLFRNLLIGAQGSYKLPIKKHTLSIGLQIGYYHSKFKGSDLVINTGSGNMPGDTDLTRAYFTREGETDIDPMPGEGEGGEENTPDPDPNEEAPNYDVAAGMFDLGIGLRYEHPKFHVGISALHLTNPTLKLSREGEESSDARYMESKLPTTLYFDAGGNIAINNSLISLQPSLLVATDFSDFSGIVEMRATYNRMISLGVDYRYNRAVGVIASLTLKDFYIGYNWEYDYSYHPKGSTGNHELVIGYQFKLNMGGKNTFSHRSIRIM